MLKVSMMKTCKNRMTQKESPTFLSTVMKRVQRCHKLLIKVVMLNLNVKAVLSHIEAITIQNVIIRFDLFHVVCLTEAIIVRRIICHSRTSMSTMMCTTLCRRDLRKMIHIMQYMMNSKQSIRRRTSFKIEYMMLRFRCLIRIVLYPLISLFMLLLEN